MRDNLNRRLACLSASLFSFYNLLLFSLMNVLGGYLMHDFHLTPAQLGFLSSWDLWGNVLGFLPIGLLLDRYGARIVAIPLLSVAIGATFMMSMTHHLSLLCGMRFLQGLASAGSLLVTMRLGATLFPQRRNMTIGWMITIALSGGIAGNSLFAYLASYFGWREGLIIIASIGVFCLFMMLAGLRDQQLRVKIKPLTFSFKAINAATILGGLNIGLLNVPVFVLGSLFGNQYLVHKANLNLTQAAGYSTLLFVGIMMGSPLWGILADKCGSFKMLFAGYLSLIALSFLLGFSSTPNLLAILFFGFGFCCCVQNLIYPLLSQCTPENLRSTGMGIASIVSNSVGAGVQLLFGVIMQLSIQNSEINIKIFHLLFMGGLIMLALLLKSKKSLFT